MLVYCTFDYVFIVIEVEDDKFNNNNCISSKNEDLVFNKCENESELEELEKKFYAMCTHEYVKSSNFEVCQRKFYDNDVDFEERVNAVKQALIEDYNNITTDDYSFYKL